MQYVVGLSTWLTGNITNCQLFPIALGFRFTQKFIFCMCVQHLKLERKLYSYKYQYLCFQHKHFDPFKSSLCQDDEHDWSQDWFGSSPERTVGPLSVIRRPLVFGKQPCDCVLKQLGTFEVWLISSYSREALGTKCDSRDAGTRPPSSRKSLSRHVGWQCVCAGWDSEWVWERVRDLSEPL